jgi:spore coat polysaccharide biosynthesis protein SpsF
MSLTPSKRRDQFSEKGGNRMKIVAIVQARMGSTRLPGKVMKDLLGAPVLVRDVNRLRRSKLLDEIVIATTTLPADDQIVSLCKDQGWPYFRGDENDVLDRYYQAARAYNADVIVRITSDCPMIDPEIVDRVIKAFLDISGIDYVSNTLPPRTFPRGLDTEVMTFDALERAWTEDKDPKLREHVTPYIYWNPEIFQIYGVVNETDLSSHRWTLDTPEDLLFIQTVYERFGGDRFSWGDVLEYLNENPKIIKINQHIQQKHI